MINLTRSKEHKWIFQKNVSSVDIINFFLKTMKKFNNLAEKSFLLQQFQQNRLYKGRSVSGSTSTMGVRTSQMKFYMFGYSLPSKSNNTFFLSPMSVEMLKNNDRFNIAKMSLINLFSIQFPHPFSKTPPCFKLHAGRLILKLIAEEKLDKKIYIDEFCYFVPFVENINEKIYADLVDSILEFRKLSFEEKDQLFKEVPNYNDVFANVFHEFNYYFFRIFEGLGVFSLVEDKFYNQGKLHVFTHGKSTKRDDAYKSRKKHSGYVKLRDNLVSYVDELLKNYSVFDKVESLADSCVFSKEDFIFSLYQIKPLKYLSLIDKQKYSKNDEVSRVLHNMVYMSKYGDKTGKDFENSLKPVFELFRQAANVEIISGSGDTDILCTMIDKNNSKYKINVDAKTSHSSTSMLNGSRLENHLLIHNSKYCIVVSTRFARGVSNDIKKYKIVAINAETLANYCFNEFNCSPDGFIDYSILEKIISANLGNNITEIVDNFIKSFYGFF